MSEDECIDNEYFKEISETHDDAANLFTSAELEDLKKREAALMERNEKGYYHSKIDHADLYREISAAYQPYITEDMLSQLQHTWSTQGNEAMNQSVSAFAPKGKTYSLMTSLDTRVAIAGGIQIVGYKTFWELVFHAMDIDMDDNLRKHLANKDKHKERKTKVQVSKEGKKKRGEKKYDKLNQAHDEWIEQQRTGDGYQTGVAVAVAIAKKNVPAASERNPKGTPKEQWKCPFYPHYCTVLGHKDARNKDCGMKGKSKEEKEAAKKAMLDTAVSQEMIRMAENGKDFGDNVKETLFLF